jgi:hypothetical protein
MPKFIARNDGFICDNCRKRVEPIKWGGSYRNHCPFCLVSKHVDGPVPGDRANNCRVVMRAVGVMTKSRGEFTILHRCEKCGFERLNRVAGDDDSELLTKLAGKVIK